jgi:phosphatidylglycerophosphate synthase
MTTTKKITVADVRESFNPNIKGDLTIVYFGRPMANLITPFFHNRGWTANEMTVARAGIATVGLALLAFPSPVLWQISAGIFFLCFVLDCVDGNLARIQNDASYYGKFLDGLVDAYYPYLSSLFLGIGCWLYTDEPLILILGGLITTVSVSSQMTRFRLSFFREWMTSQTGELTQDELKKAARSRWFQNRMADIHVNVFFLAALALFLPLPMYALGGYFIFAFISQFVADLLWLAGCLAEAGALLRRGRVSKHARVQTSSGDTITGVAK